VPLICGKALRKIFHLAIGSLGAGRRRSGQIPANRRPGPAWRGRGRFHGALGVDFHAPLGREGAGEAGAPAARRGGRCGRCAGEVGLRRRLGGLGARVGAKEGGGEFSWVHSQPGPELRRGCQQWRRRRLSPGHDRDEKGGDRFIGDERACQRPKRPTATSRSMRWPR
jgi:hypothetical protein